MGAMRSFTKKSAFDLSVLSTLIKEGTFKQSLE